MEKLIVELIQIVNSGMKWPVSQKRKTVLRKDWNLRNTSWKKVSTGFSTGLNVSK